MLHPDQTADALQGDTFLDTDSITTLDRVEPSTTLLQTKLGITFVETEQATCGEVVGPNRRRAGRLTVKTDIQRQRYDLGASTGGALFKGVTAWEFIDAVVLRGDTVAKCAVWP